MMGGMGADRFEGGGGVDVPIETQRTRRANRRDSLFELRVENAYSTRLHQKIGTPRRVRESRLPAVRGRRINDDACPRRIGNVAVPLAIECVGLIESNSVAKGCKRLQHSAIVGGGAIPIGGDKA